MSMLKLAVKYKKEIAEKDIKIERLLNVIDEYENALMNEGLYEFVCSVQSEYKDSLGNVL